MRTQCEFDAEPPAIVFYVKEDPVTKMWHRIHDRNNVSTGHFYNNLQKPPDDHNILGLNYL